MAVFEFSTHPADQSSILIPPTTGYVHRAVPFLGQFGDGMAA
jgi:hypothetical protein